VEGYVAMGGGHHVFGRAKVDVPEAIVGLCSQHHFEAHKAKISKCDLITLAEEVSQVELRIKYREFHKCLVNP
jgi:hypothetical protein